MNDYLDMIIVERIEVPKDQIFLLQERRPSETLEEWAKRCAVIYNVLPPDNG